MKSLTGHQSSLERRALRLSHAFKVSVVVGLTMAMGGCNTLPSRVESDVSVANPADDATNVQPPGPGYSIVIYPESRCLSRALERAMPDGNAIMQTQRFREELFPWLEPKYLPSSQEDLTQLLSRPKVPARLKSLNVRYLITFTDGHTAIGGFPGMKCGASAAVGMGCLGASSEKYATSLEAVLWDFERRQKTADVDAKATGRRYGIALGLPAFVWADTNKDACREAATLIAELMDQPSTAN